MTARQSAQSSQPPDEDDESRAARVSSVLAWRAPHYSAFHRISRGQLIFLYLAATLVLAGLVVAPRFCASLIVAALSLFFLASFVYKALLFFLGSAPVQEKAQPRHSDHALPVYTLLVPLYREERLIAQLVTALDRLDYPKDRLDIKLIVEADDAPMQRAIEALKLAAPYAVIRVPPIGPRTKPKALSFALEEARGEFVVVFDAEDQPEPDQLRAALARFAALGPQTICLQARLNFFNAQENLLTRLFAIDYCLWFDALLRGLEILGAPLPLGGTSNHFRRGALIEIGGWDPYNVTEDADLGFRIAREGLKVATLDSTTFEEAPVRLGAWLAQRTRWIKGYLQTWLVHMRDPARLLRECGWRGVITLHLFLLGTALAGLIGPLLWALFAGWVATGHGLLSGFTGGALLLISLFGLVAGNALLIFLSLLAPLRRDWLFLLPSALIVPLYWIAVSLAAWRALFELMVRPFYWAKTPHGLTAFAAQTRPGGRARAS